MWMEELPNGKFTYRERYKDPYTEKYKKVSVTLNSKSNQAKNKAQRMLNEKIKKGPNDKNKLTFEQLYEKYKPIYKQNVRDSTFRHFESCYRVVTKWFDEKSIVRNITSEYLQNCLDKFYYEQGYSYPYLYSLRAFLSNLFSYGKRIGACDFNPVNDVKLAKKEVEREREEKKANKYLEDDELTLILNTIRNWPKAPRKYRYAEILELMSLTGMRFGEAAALKEEDLDGNLLKIDESLYYNYGNLKNGDTNRTKNVYSNRTISLSKRSMKILYKWKTENHNYKTLYPDNYKDMGFLFCDISGIPIGIGPVNGILRKVRSKLKKEGKIDKDITTHYFRHTHISKLAELGIPLKTIMDRVGHSSPNTTLQIYTHVTKKMDQQLIDKLNKDEKKE